MRKFSLASLVTILFVGVADAQIVDPSLKNRDFVINFGNLPGTSGPGGVLVGANAGNTKALINSGLAFAEVTLNPGGANSPHIHPRAVEALYVIEGVLRVCFVEENGGSTHCNNLKAGEATFFPMGSIHYQQNFGKTAARFLAVLTSDNPGTLTVAPRMFTLPLEILSAAFNVETEALAGVRDNLPANPVAAGPGAFPAQRAPLPWGVRKNIARLVKENRLAHRMRTAIWYLTVAIALGVVDAIAALRRINEKREEAMEVDPSGMSATMSMHMRNAGKFRAQRNMYLAGSVLALLFALKRIIDLVTNEIALRDEILRLSGKETKIGTPMENKEEPLKATPIDTHKTK